ncbi:MAG: PASTA domain-containing protein [Actinomycetota bacterium]|nr:PASTA domain-containing protein [Actinomycetota bacterium]
MRSRLEAETVVDGRYKVLKRLGSGGMADVYCAEDLQLGRRVALKVLYGRFASDQEFVERFRREASSAAGLQHQHVVGVYDRGEWDDTYYIAMEFLDGRSLKQIVDDEGPLEPARAVDLTTQVLRAARFAHRRGVIHRDLKPHNVIVDADGRAKVTDFGIARAGASDMTQTGSIMGTAQYLSPEQAQGHPVSEQSDLYSVGVMLYELLTARLPFDGESAVTIALKHVNEEPVRPSALNPAVSPALDAVVLRAMEKDPARRFSSADEFIAALQAAAAQPTTVLSAAEPVSETYYPAAPLVDEERERGRWWPWALLLLLIAGALVAFFALRGSDGARQVAVPNVVGADQASAEAKLRQEGFKIATVARNSDQPKGQVVGQDPPGDEKAAKGSTVNLTVSDGPAQVGVPLITGLTLRSARGRLQRAGLHVGDRRSENSDSVAKGRVISVSPSEGTKVDKGSDVTLVVSSGKAQATVPAVVGKSFDEARSTLEAAGFRVTRRDQESSDKPADTVLAQSPPGASKVDEGSTVALTVAKEPAQVDVTDVTGETSGDAVRRLSKDGFEVDQKTQTVDSPEGDDTVLSQSPAGGKAKKGSTVTITVGKYKAPAVTTPTTTTPAPPAAPAPATP